MLDLRPIVGTLSALTPVLGHLPYLVKQGPNISPPEIPAKSLLDWGEQSMR
ncbi:MAG: hypothetical protein NVSMB44_04390 [Ktedonobacteraceae bacterium]